VHLLDAPPDVLLLLEPGVVQVLLAVLLVVGRRRGLGETAAGRRGQPLAQPG